MKNFLLIDGNSIMNRAFYGIMGSNLLTNKDGKYTNALYGFLNILFKNLEMIKPDYICVAFDSKTGANVRKQKYDGYHFSKQMVGIYNPFSLCNALQDKELKDYWFSSGTPTFMVRLLEENAFDIPDLEGNMRVDAKNIDDYRIDYANITPLLFQAGYLTIKDYDRELDMYVLGYPNDEVKYAFVYHLMATYTDGKTLALGEFRIDFFNEAIQKGDMDRLLNLIKSLLASIPYDSFPKDKLFLREHNYQTAIYLIFCLMGQYVRCEVHSSKGRSDVEVETKDAIYIFEFKVGGKPIDAINQIKDSGYLDKYSASKKNIFLIGANISRNRRTLGRWTIEKVM